MMEISVLRCAELLDQKKLKIAFVESATSGALCSKFALTPFSENILLGSIVSYHASAKNDILNISDKFLKDYSAQSPEVTKLMAIRAQALFKKANLLVAVTGITKNGENETVNKPVGTMFIHIIYQNKSFVFKEFFKGNSHQIIDKTIQFISNSIINLINSNHFILNN